MILEKDQTEPEQAQIGKELLHDYILNPANAIYQEISPLCIEEFQQHISDHQKRLQVANDIVDEQKRNEQLSQIYNSEWQAANLMHEIHANPGQSLREFPTKNRNDGGPEMLDNL